MALDQVWSDPFTRRHIPVLDSRMSFIEAGDGAPIVFLHGNPTSSYLWRRVMPHLIGLGRVLAPDLIGMGQSGPDPAGSYRFADQARYLAAWLEAVAAGDQVILVGHDWGSALAFDWAYGQRDGKRVQGLAYMEALVRPLTWPEWPEAARGIFQALRSPKGEELILERNFFIERILPASVLRPLTGDEMDAYRAPFSAAGESRRPMLTWPREIPLDGQPADVAARLTAYAAWLAQSELPKLFINAEPGMILTGAQREFCRTWPNQVEVTVLGLHFVQEDAPDEIGRALVAFVRRLRERSGD